MIIKIEEIHVQRGLLRNVGLAGYFLGFIHPRLLNKQIKTRQTPPFMPFGYVCIDLLEPLD